MPTASARCPPRGSPGSPKSASKTATWSSPAPTPGSSIDRGRARGGAGGPPSGPRTSADPSGPRSMFPGCSRKKGPGSGRTSCESLSHWKPASTSCPSGGTARTPPRSGTLVRPSRLSKKSNKDEEEWFHHCVGDIKASDIMDFQDCL